MHDPGAESPPREYAVIRGETSKEDADDEKRLLQH